MRRVEGWTEARIRERERVFDGLVLKATRMSLRALSARAGDLVTAAGGPALSPEPAPFGVAFTQVEATVVTATWEGYVDRELMPYLADTFLEAAAGTGTALDVPGTRLTRASGALKEYLASALVKLKNVGYLIWDTLQAHVFANGAAESPRQLAARVREVASLTEGRALNTARTAVVAAANAGSLAQVLDAGFTDSECLKEWLATEDERTRVAHHIADGQRVPVSQPFDVGGEGLQFPGDPLGRPDNVYNCRCTLAYVFADEGDREVDLLTAGFLRRWIEKLHPRDKAGRFGRKSAFQILPVSERGRSGDEMYAPGMWGKFGAAGVMMRADDNGTPRYLVVQRGNGTYNKYRWQLPGGALEEHETPQQGAARETFEEIGAPQNFLDQLTERGTHRVDIPVKGKDPWAYSNVTADAPYMLKPQIDPHELAAARWLTEEQLREMMSRGRLIKPFADNLDKILAQFDGKPLTAAAKTDWKPQLHPRAKDGEFRNSLPDVSKLMHLNFPTESRKLHRDISGSGTESVFTGEDVKALTTAVEGKYAGGLSVRNATARRSSVELADLGIHSIPNPDWKTGDDPDDKELSTDGKRIDTLRLEGEVADASGKHVGVFVRLFFHDPELNDELTVEHKFLSIAPHVQGQGFAQDFNSRLEKIYRAGGVKKIILDADIDVGGYAWAVAGFDFRGNARSWIMNRLRSTVADKTGVYTFQMKERLGKRFDEQLAVAQKFVQDNRINPYVKPIDVAQIGRQKGQGKGDWWFGKALLMGAQWWAQRRLDEEDTGA